MPYANNKGPDQLAHPRSLISAFFVHCLDSMIPLLTIVEISRPKLVSVVEQAGLSLTWSKPLKTGFLMMRLILQQTLKFFLDYNRRSEPQHIIINQLEQHNRGRRPIDLKLRLILMPILVFVIHKNLIYSKKPQAFMTKKVIIMWYLYARIML